MQVCLITYGLFLPQSITGLKKSIDSVSVTFIFYFPQKIRDNCRGMDAFSNFVVIASLLRRFNDQIKEKYLQDFY